MNANFIPRWYATLGPIGYFPASGTAASAATLMLLWLLPSTSSWLFFAIIGLCYSLAYCCIQKNLVFYKHEDPSEIVIDELIGTLITFCALPLTPLTLILGFILFRFFDISKFGPVGWMEKVPGASGILLDDLVAGLLSNLVLRLIVHLYGS